MKNKIILEAETELKDNQLWNIVSKIQRQMDSINERTKRQTKDIQELRSLIKSKETKQ